MLMPNVFPLYSKNTTLIDEIDLVSKSGSVVKINADKSKIDVNGTAVVEDMTTGDFSMRMRGQAVEMHYQNCSESGFTLCGWGVLREPHPLG